MFDVDWSFSVIRHHSSQATDQVRNRPARRRPAGLQSSRKASTAHSWKLSERIDRRAVQRRRPGDGEFQPLRPFGGDERAQDGASVPSPAAGWRIVRERRAAAEPVTALAKVSRVIGLVIGISIEAGGTALVRRCREDKLSRSA